MAFNKNNPHNDLPFLPPDKKYFETINVYKKLSEAKASLAELKGRVPVIPNPFMLINTLVLQEARDSSIIENIVTSNDKLFRAFSSSQIIKDTNTKEVLRYREAVWQAYQELIDKGNIDLELIIKIFQVIKETNEGIRKKQVWIGNAYNTIYTPPEPGKILKNKLDNWINFAVFDNDTDPLIKMALLHYQFECIHPFSDGNGRTGRILNVLYLTYKKLLDLPILYLSKYILEYKSEYYRLFNEVIEKEKWEDWILYMLEAVKQTATFTLAKVNAIYELFQKTQQQIKTEANNIYSYELVEILFHQPYCKIGILVKNKIASRNTASKYLNRLVDIGILLKREEGKEILYLNKELYEILSRS